MVRFLSIQNITGYDRLFIFYEKLQNNVLHVTFYTTTDLGAHFYRYFYVTTDRCKSYLDQQIEHEIWFSRQLVWQLTEISYTYPQWLGILSNALWHYLAQCKQQTYKSHTIIFTYNSCPQIKWNMNDKWLNDIIWSLSKNTWKKIYINIHLSREINFNKKYVI